MELVEKVKLFFRDVLCVEYNGHIEYTHDNEDYTLSFVLNPDDNRPLILQGQFFSEDKFYDYIVKEIKNKRFHIYKNFRVYRSDINESAEEVKTKKKNVDKRL